MRLGSFVRIQSISMIKTICGIQHTKKSRSRKNNGKDEKVLYKLMNDAIYEKTMENLRNRIDVKLVNYEKKTSYGTKYLTTI